MLLLLRPVSLDSARRQYLWLRLLRAACQPGAPAPAALCRCSMSTPLLFRLIWGMFGVHVYAVHEISCHPEHSPNFGLSSGLICTEGGLKNLRYPLNETLKARSCPLVLLQPSYAGLSEG